MSAIGAMTAGESGDPVAMLRRRDPQVGDHRHVPFFETTVARYVFNTIERCLHWGYNGLILGEPGVGKTKALQEYVRRHGGNTGHCRSTDLIDVHGAMGGSMSAVLEKMGDAYAVFLRKNAFVAQSVEYMCTRAGRNPSLLIFDEAQNLDYRIVRDVLAIGERTGCVMLFCGNDEVLRLVSAANAPIKQIGRRIQVRETIGCILDSDADLIADHFRIDGSEARDLCRRLGQVHHADGIVTVLSHARDRLGPDRPIQAADIREALNHFSHFRAGLVPERGKRPQRQTSLARPPIPAKRHRIAR